MADETNDPSLAELTALITSNYVANNQVAPRDLPALIATLHSALSGLGAPDEAPAERAAPAVQIRKSVTPDHLISLEDGRKYKTLKRHLAGLGLTPAEYRKKWGLRDDYPMVAPNYSIARSAMAKSMGLGAGGRKPPATPAAPAKVPAKRASPKSKAIKPSEDTFT